MYIKGFDKNLKCCVYQFEIGFQFEIGKEYKIENGEKPLELGTNTVFHFCDSLEKLHNFYDINSSNIFCEIEVLGNLIQDYHDMGSNHIKIIREIKGKELKKLKKQYKNNNTGSFNEGDRNTGNKNTGDRNTGHNNKGDFNTGFNNMGDWNTGHNNIGHNNTGIGNKGDFNAGSFNATNNTIGIFNTRPTYRAFNRKFTKSQYMRIRKSKGYEVLCRFFLKNNYEDSWNFLYSSLSNEDIEHIRNIPYVDLVILKKITGIDFSKDKDI
ncbi:MAG: pentapeptide repeat-containing protein [Chitinophagaceae bacterium]